MERLTSIVALNLQGAIGCQNELPWRLGTDMKFFRSQTINNVVIMGRKTWDSIGSSLPKRHNIVLSHNAVLFEETSEREVVTTIDEALFSADQFSSGEAFIIGGASTYLQFGPFVDRYLITIVQKEVSGADAFFDDSLLDNEVDWVWNKLDHIKWHPERDDAEFEVFEVLHRRPEELRLWRNAVIAQYQGKVDSIRKPSVKRKHWSKGTFLSPQLL